MIHLSWFSPLPPAKTDIANYTTRLMPHLNRSAICRFVTPADIDSRFAFTGTGGARELNTADFNIYQIGNDERHHASIVKLARRTPGIVILHDRAINELILGMEGDGGETAGMAYRQAMARWYGQDGISAAEAVLQGRTTASSVAARYPLFETVLDGALGAVVHNTEVGRELTTRFPRLPVLTLPLPYAEQVVRACPAPKKDHKDHRIRLAMFGYMAANRRVCEFLTAWANSPHRDLFLLDLAGDLKNTSEINSLIISSGLHNQVRIHGYLPEQALDQMIAEADLALNLRNPTMGEASGSQLRIWANATASVVTDAGWYAQLPDDSVHKIPVDDENAALLRLLDRLAHKNLDLRALGENGRRRLQHHDPANYVATLIDWLEGNRQQMSERYCEVTLIKTVAESFAKLLPANQRPSIPSRLLPSTPRQ